MSPAYVLTSTGFLFPKVAFKAQREKIAKLRDALSAEPPSNLRREPSMVEGAYTCICVTCCADWIKHD